MKQRFSFPVFICATILILSGCVAAPKPPLAQDGYLDLSKWNFENDGIVELNGEWEFYWHELYSPDDFSKTVPPKIGSYFNIPGRWDGKIIEGEQQSGDGWGTFRLTVDLHPDSAVMAVRTPEQATAYRLWVNGEEVAKNGTVGQTPETSKPQYLLQLAPFHVAAAEKTSLEFVLQVSNYHYRKGGVWYPIELGNADNILQRQYLEWAADLFIFGGLLIMGVYYLLLYLLRRREVSALYFAIFCMMMAVRAIFTDTRFFTHLFPLFPFELLVTLELLTVTVTFPVMLMFICSLYPSESSKWAVRSTQLIGGLFSLFAIVFEARVASYIVGPYQVVLLLLFLYIIWVLVRAVARGRTGARSILLGISIFHLSVLNDVLAANDIIYTPSLASVGMLALVITQSYGLTKRFARAFSTVEKLSAELKERIEVEHYLRQDQKRLTEMLDTVEGAIVAVDESGDISFCNSGFSQLTGVATNELEGRPLRELFPGGEVPESLEQGIALALQAEGETQSFGPVKVLRGKGELEVDVKLATLDLEEENLVVLSVKAAADKPTNGAADAGAKLPAMEIVEELNRNRHRLRVLEESLGEELEKTGWISSYHESIEGIDKALENLTDILGNEDQSLSRRELAVHLMNSSLDLWLESTGKSKAEFAIRSRLWKVYTDHDGGKRTQTLDRYLLTSTIPKLPRWSKVIGTAKFVLAECVADSPEKERIEELLAKLKAMK